MITRVVVVGMSMLLWAIKVVGGAPTPVWVVVVGYFKNVVQIVILVHMVVVAEMLLWSKEWLMSSRGESCRVTNGLR